MYKYSDPLLAMKTHNINIKTITLGVEFHSPRCPWSPESDLNNQLARDYCSLWLLSIVKIG